MDRQFIIEVLKKICRDPHVCGFCLRPSTHIDGHLCPTCKTIMPRRLPVTSVGDGKLYFFDKRLRELRNIRDPTDRIDLRHTKNRTTNEADSFIRVICPRCGKLLFRGTKHERKSHILYCVDCF